ncbi:hypothetical protein PROFUN_15960 [Planoprotostelium fungivorum]|uniref:Uncharacterized protein n=1 Tax=Planoprotostelium fungivorum TaxID=1890364 RepID=A0A2P6MU28_9EUKA|nr:hypothetical protein PROFUN_15960 [Planoprotostelium fungivorum]
MDEQPVHMPLGVEPPFCCLMNFKILKTTIWGVSSLYVLSVKAIVIPRGCAHLYLYPCRDVTRSLLAALQGDFSFQTKAQRFLGWPKKVGDPF